jgi:hypothetical protein
MVRGRGVSLLVSLSPLSSISCVSLLMQRRPGLVNLPHFPQSSDFQIKAIALEFATDP